MSLIAIVFYVLIVCCLLSAVAYIPIPDLPKPVRVVASIVIVLLALVWLGNRLGVLHGTL